MTEPGRAIDLDHLDRYTGGDPALNAEILRLFEGQASEMLGRLEALGAGPADAKLWREITHTLKGASRGIGAFALGDAAAEAEQAAADRTAAVAALERLKRQSAAVTAFIAEILNQPA